MSVPRRAAVNVLDPIQGERDLVRLVLDFVNAETPTRRAAAVVGLLSHPFTLERRLVARLLQDAKARDSEWPSLQAELREALGRVARNRARAASDLLLPLLAQLKTL